VSVEKVMVASVIQQMALYVQSLNNLAGKRTFCFFAVFPATLPALLAGRCQTNNLVVFVDKPVRFLQT